MPELINFNDIIGQYSTSNNLEGSPQMTPIKFEEIVFDKTPFVKSASVGEYNLTSKFDKGILPGMDISKVRGERQPWYEQAGSMLNQAAVGEVLGGTLMSIGSIFEIPEMVANTIDGSDDDFHNFVYDLGKGLSDWTQEATPIYQTGERFGDSGWWFQNGVSIASSLSMLLPGMAAAKVGRGIAKGLSLGRTATDIMGTTVGALTMRHAEGFREASGVYDSIYQQGLQAYNEGRLPEIKSEEELRHIASNAAALDYNLNYLNTAFDFIQLGAILKPFKNLTRNAGLLEYDLAKQVGKLPKSKLGKAAYWMAEPGKGILEQTSEGFEEVVNTIAQFEGERKGKLDLGLEKDDGSTVGERVMDYLGRPETTDSFIWGTLGGVAFKALGKPVAKALNLPIDNTLDRKLAEVANRETVIKQFAEHFGAINNGEVVRDEEGKVVNDYSKTTKEQRDELTTDLKNKMAFRLGLDASQAGNVDLLLAQLEDKDFQSKLIESGVATKESIHTDLQNIKKEVLRAEDTYSKYFQRLYELPVNDKVKRQLLNEAIQTDYRRSSALEGIKELETEYNKLYAGDGFIQVNAVNPNLQPTIQMEALTVALEMVNRDLEEAKKSNNTYAVQQNEKIKKNLEKKLNNIPKHEHINPKLIDVRIPHNLGQQEILREYVNLFSEKIADVDSKTNVNKVQEEVTNIEAEINAQINEVKKQNDVSKKQERINQQKLNKDLDNLAKKISTANKETEYTPEELQLQTNYPEELEERLKFSTVENLDARNERQFNKQINSMNDEMFLSEYENIKNNIVSTISNALEYLKSDISQDEKTSLGEILKREHRKLRILEDKFNKSTFTEKDVIPLGELSETTTRNKQELLRELKQEELNETLINDIVDNLSEDGREFTIRGKKYYNLYSFSDNVTGTPGAINRDSNGEIISVTLVNEDGKNVTFRDSKIVDAVAYVILLQEVSEYESKSPVELDTNKITNVAETIENSIDSKTTLSMLQQDLYEINETLDFIDLEIKQTKYEYKKIGYSVNDALQDPKVITLLEQKSQLTEIRKVILNKISNLTGNTNEKEQVKAVRRKSATRNKESVKRKISKGKEQIATGTTEAIQPVEQQPVQQNFAFEQQLAQAEKVTEQPVQQEEVVEPEVITPEVVINDEVKSEEITLVNTDIELYDDDKHKQIEKDFDKLNEDLKNASGAKTLGDNGEIVYDNRKIENGHNTLAHLDRKYSRVKEGNTVKYLDETDELDENAPLKLLNPNKYPVGTEVEFVVVDKDDMELYDPDSKDKEVITWAVYKKRLQDKNPNKDITILQDYKDNVPMQLRIGNEEFNAYLHSTAWINEENVVGDIVQDNTNMRNIRNGIIANGGTYKTTIDKVGNGVLFILKDNKTHSIKEAVGEDTNYTIGVGTGDGIKLGKNKLLKEGLVNSETTSGATYLVVDVNSGKMGIPVRSTKIGNSIHKDSIKASIVNAVDAYLTDNVAVRDEIRDITGLNIFQFNDLEYFLKMYLGFYNNNGVFLRELINSIPHSTKNTYFSVHSKTIEFFDGDLEKGGRVYSISKNKKEKKDLFLNKLMGSLDNFYLNNSIEAFDSNQIIPIFDKNNNLVPKPYRDLIMENFTTNVKGNKVDEVDGKPVYSYTLQPVYRFNFNEFLPKENIAEEEVSIETSEEKTEEVLSSDTDSLINGFLNFSDFPGAFNPSFNKDIKNSHKKC